MLLLPCRVLHLMASLYIAGRDELVQEMVLMKYDSMQLLQDPDKAHCEWVLTQLGLTLHQKQRVAAGLKVFR